ncbi:hypothetical protein [Rathayibacter soli]|uniref:hypothetical protein n=1 Tax=Rathayibacter soli TaxID=3144168 RepID=UPI0027E40AFC|nr:hypothetical protein [Glaciibacter superstes]
MTKTENLTLYMVYWPAVGVVKIGVAGHLARVRRFAATGAIVVMLIEQRTTADERRALTRIRRRFERAFVTAADSIEILPSGRGYSECYRASIEDLPTVVAMVLQGVAARAAD